MEDLNMIAADCIIISCCCQCLILQVLIYILFRLPYKLFRKAMRRLKRIGDRKQGKKVEPMGIRGVYDSESLASLGDSFRRMHVEGLFLDGCCMDEVEKVLEEFSLKGEFAFGSFWDGEGSRRFSGYLLSSSSSFRTVISPKIVYHMPDEIIPSLV